MFLIYYDNCNHPDGITFLGLTQTKEDADKIVSLYDQKLNYRCNIKRVTVSVYSSDQINKMCKKQEIAIKAREKLTDEEYNCLVEAIYDRS